MKTIYCLHFSLLVVQFYHLRGVGSMPEEEIVNILWMVNKNMINKRRYKFTTQNVRVNTKSISRFPITYAKNRLSFKERFDCFSTLSAV